MSQNFLDDLCRRILLSTGEDRKRMYLYLGSPRRNIAIPFDTEKLEWCGYPMVKKFEDYV